LQLINILFAVPQISVHLNTLPASHLAMLRYWLAFWREHRDVLLDGELAVLHPETHYPLVRATNAQKRVVAAYQEAIIDPGPELPDTLIVVNGTREKRVVLDITENLGKRQATIRDCQGEIISEKQLVVPKGFLSLDVPAAGVCILSSEEK
jgi:alpha-galactosidase